MARKRREQETDNYTSRVVVNVEPKGQSQTAQPADLADPKHEDPGARICFSNWMVPNGADLFPTEPKLRIVDRHYPYAVGGALFVDAVKYESELPEYEKKRAALVGSGMRYVYLKPKEDLFDAMRKLEELDNGMVNIHN